KRGLLPRNHSGNRHTPLSPIGAGCMIPRLAFDPRSYPPPKIGVGNCYHPPPTWRWKTLSPAR
ncbi:MAG TPA: hypothetical protein PKK24_07565, partial [Anaerolineaceae bacterium]|nr:hypothetical protein [Anaerolineaceae bacterium]